MISQRESRPWRWLFHKGVKKALTRSRNPAPVPPVDAAAVDNPGGRTAADQPMGSTAHLPVLSKEAEDAIAREPEKYMPIYKVMVEPFRNERMAIGAKVKDWLAQTPDSFDDPIVPLVALDSHEEESLESLESFTPVDI